MSSPTPHRPGFWKNETSGVLAPVVKAYIEGATLDARQIIVMRAYLRQWIYAPVWAPGPELAALRQSVEAIRTTADVHRWIDDAMEIEIDPL